METKRLSQQDIQTAADLLRAGGLVGIPTETVYGLGANGLDPAAVGRIFQAKGRPQDNPLILHIPGADWLERYCRDIPAAAYELARRFWPGPLTMVLRRRDNVPDQVTAGLDTVGMRCPAHPLCRAVIQAADVPVAAPSGNTSGRPSPTTAAHMLEDMDGRIDAILDGGPCSVGVESTIVDLTCTPPRLLRPGGITLEQLRAAAGPGDGVICFEEFLPMYAGGARPVMSLGPAGDKGEQARRVFDALRAFDHTAVSAIWAQCPDSGGIGLAVTNRLNKAAGFHIVEA